jgi:hypothetical protein
MANTGKLITTTLISVRSDITDPTDPLYQEALDINGNPTRSSGLSQYSKNNVNTDTNYIAPYQNLSECPIPSTTTSTTTTTTTTL